MSPCIAHLPSSPFALERISVTRARNGLDSAKQRFWAPTSDYLREGMRHPENSNFVIEEVVREGDDDEGYEYDVSSKGLAAGKFRRVDGFPSRRGQIQDWDTETDQWLSTNPQHFARGQWYNGKICTEASAEPLHAELGVYRCTAQLVGLNAGPRRVSREVNCNAAQVSRDKVKVTLPGGWNDYRKGVLSLPKVTVTDTWLAYSPPPTGLIPGTLTPPNAPPVRIITLTGDDLTWHWPNGWTFTVQSSQPFGDVSLWRNQWVYEWTADRTF